MTIRLKPEVVVITLTNLHHEVGHDLERAAIPVMLVFATAEA